MIQIKINSNFLTLLGRHKSVYWRQMVSPSRDPISYENYLKSRLSTIFPQPTLDAPMLPGKISAESRQMANWLRLPANWSHPSYIQNWIRAAFAYFENWKVRILIHCGWNKTIIKLHDKKKFTDQSHIVVDYKKWKLN